MNPQALLAWWNLIFVVPFGLALVYLALYTLGGVTFGEADADGDFDHDVDAHVDVDADADADVNADGDLHADADTHIDADADHDVDHDVEGDGATGGHTSLHAAALAFLGVGRVPLSVLLMVLLMTWGATGFVVNQIAAMRLGGGAGVAMVSIPIAALAALALTRMLVRAIDRWLPLNETTARRRHELLGRAGEAIFPIGAQFGLAAVRDDRGELYQVPCRLDPETDAPLPKGSRVRLVAYSAKNKSFFVTASEPGGGAGV